jgi:hypothetical protein
MGVIRGFYRTSLSIEIALGQKDKGVQNSLYSNLCDIYFGLHVSIVLWLVELSKKLEKV